MEGHTWAGGDGLLFGVSGGHKLMLKKFLFMPLVDQNVF